MLSLRRLLTHFNISNMSRPYRGRKNYRGGYGGNKWRDGPDSSSGRGGSGSGRYYDRDTEGHSGVDYYRGLKHGAASFQEADDDASFSGSRSSGFRGRGGRGRHPPGLKGKEIGLFYARLGQKRKKDDELDKRAEVNIEDEDAKYLQNLVDESTEADETPWQGAPEQMNTTSTYWSRMSLHKDHNLDEDYKDHHDRIQKNSEYRRLYEFRTKLPSYSRAMEIVSTIESNRVTVISGETGCGKTTQVPQFILDHYIKEDNASMCRVVCTQPRRISAITVAERVAAERADRCGSVGSSAGYQIRLEAKYPRTSGSILFCTTGIVLKWLETDKNLNNVSHLILDEVHERDLQTDFLMIVLKDILRNNPNIRVILMSATLNSEKFSKYYNNAAMLHIPGFTYPVKEFYMEDILETVQYKEIKTNRHVDKPAWKRHKKMSQEDIDKEADFQAFLRHISPNFSVDTINALKRMDYDVIDLDCIVQLIEYICRRKPEGAILVFLPGWEQISTVYKMLNSMSMFNSGKFRILPLHSMMPTMNQREVFDRPPSDVRKIILSTNIAETSVTIDDIVYVIDCGKVKIKNYDSENNLATLQPEWNSLANSRQRRGRAGRVQPGECYHFYTTWHEGNLASYQEPEMLRTRLDDLCLQIKLLKVGGIKDFIMRAMNQPEELTLEQSISLLKEIHALDVNEELTPLGHHLARLPVDPQAGKMILIGAMFSCLDPILTIAASLNFKDAFIIPLGKEKLADHKRRILSRESKSDHMMLANAFEGWEQATRQGNNRQYCYDNFLSQQTLKMLQTMKGQFADYLYDLGFISTRDTKDPAANINSNNEKLIKAIICAGLYPNVAKISTRHNKHSSKHSFTLKDGSRAQCHLKSVNCGEPDLGSQWLVYYLRMKTMKINIYDCTPVSPFSLLFFGGGITIRREDGQDCAVVDDWIVFRADPDITVLVMDLRAQLDSLLRRKIKSPGVTSWDRGCQEGRIMHAIMTLITRDD